MFLLRDVRKLVRSAGAAGLVFDGLSAAIPTDRKLAVLASSPLEGATLVRLLSGLARPDSGTLETTAAPSYPLGSGYGLTPLHSVRRNIAYAARIHGVVPADLIRLVASIGGLWHHLDTKLALLSPEANLRLRYALCYALPFDVLLAEGEPVPPSSDSEFVESFETLVGGRGVVFVTPHPRLAIRYCDSAAILHRGQFHLYPSLEHGVADFMRLLDRQDAEAPGADAILRRGKGALKAGRYGEMQAIADVELRSGEENSVAIWLLAEAALGQGRIDEGVRLLLLACNSEPVLDEAWNSLARLALSDVRTPRAREFAQVLSTHPKGEMRRIAVKIYYSMGDRELTRSAWQSVIEVSADNVAFMIEAGKYDLDLGRYAEAVVLFSRALEVDPECWQALYLKARAEHFLGRHHDLSATVLRLAEIRSDLAVKFAGPLAKAGYGKEAEALAALAEGGARATSGGDADILTAQARGDAPPGPAAASEAVFPGPPPR